MSAAEVIPLVLRAQKSRRKADHEKSVLVVGRIFGPRLTSVFQAAGDNTKAMERALAAGARIVQP